MTDNKCEKCHGQGRYMYDDMHIKPCEACCTHPDGWWKMENRYGDDNGKYACKRGCGTIRDSAPEERETVLA